MKILKKKKLLADKIDEYREILNKKVMKNIYSSETLKVSQEIDTLLVAYYQSTT